MIKDFITKYVEFVENIFERLYKLIYSFVDIIFKAQESKRNDPGKENSYDEEEREDLKEIICECIMLVVCLIIFAMMVKIYIYIIKADLHSAYMSSDIFTNGFNTGVL